MLPGILSWWRPSRDRRVSVVTVTRQARRRCGCWAAISCATPPTPLSCSASCLLRSTSRRRIPGRIVWPGSPGRSRTKHQPNGRERADPGAAGRDHVDRGAALATGQRLSPVAGLLAGLADPRCRSPFAYFTRACPTDGPWRPSPAKRACHGQPSPPRLHARLVCRRWITFFVAPGPRQRPAAA